MKRINLGITIGDPAGIGPEIILKILLNLNKNEKNFFLKIFGSKNIFNFYKRLLDINLDLENNEFFEIIDIPFAIDNFIPGKITADNGKQSIEAINKAIEYIKEKKIDAIITAPISKEAIALAGYDYKGHTDYFAKITNTKNYLMILANNYLRVALQTTHIPIKLVSENITEESLFEKINLFNKYLIELEGIEKPEIAVLGLNPHAGDNGIIGDEEKVIKCSIDKALECGINVSGPHVPDNIFTRDKIKKYDGFLAMYHDQGLIPLKMLGFGDSVNISYGLPFIRTSVDHGTAFDIAGKGEANEKSLQKAIEKAYFYLTKNKISLVKDKCYNILSKVYDKMMSFIDYSLWRDYIFDIVRMHNVKINKILDISCGTGKFLGEIAKVGIKGIGLDYSSEMIKVAKKMNSQYNELLEFYVSDMRDFKLDEKFDIIVSLFDSVNYLTNLEDVKKMFKNVYNHLSDIGLFIFDTTTENASLEYFDNEDYGEDFEQTAYTRRCEFDKKTKIQINKFSVFEKIVDDYYYRFKEIHYQKIYSYKEIKTLAENSGLKILAAYGDIFDFNLVNAKNEKDFLRIHWVLKKNN